MSGVKKLTMEFKKIVPKKLPEGCTAGPIDESDMLHWNASIIGPKGTPYAGARFNLDIVYPEKYPMECPTFTFVTPIYHPNIKSKETPAGEVCPPKCLKDEWSPKMSIDKCLAALQDFMENPEPGHPLESDIAEEFVNRRDDFNSNAMAFTDANCEGGRIETLTAPTITTAQLDVYLEDFKSKYTGDATKVEEMQLGLAEFRALVSHQLGRDPTDGEFDSFTKKYDYDNSNTIEFNEYLQMVMGVGWKLNGSDGNVALDAYLASK